MSASTRTVGRAAGRKPLQQAQRAGALDRLQTVMDVELAVNTLEMISDRAGGDEELSPHLGCGEPGCKQAPQIAFACAEGIDGQWGGPGGDRRGVTASCQQRGDPRAPNHARWR